MEFTLPTTKEEMFSTLQEIYQFYHFRQLKYDGITLEELKLPRLAVPNLSGQQIENDARRLLAPSQEREKKNATSEINQKIIDLKEKIAVSFCTEETLNIGVDQNYDKAIENAKKEIWKSKISDSSSAHEKIKDIELKRAEEKSKIHSVQENYRAELNAQIKGLEDELKNLENYFLSVHEMDVLKKSDEMLEDQNRTAREIQKYNDALDEKELRYRNTLKSNIASLELRYLDIHEQGFAHDELVEMGYYTDVIECATAYYNSIDPVLAYSDIRNEQRLLIYLDDYYTMLVQTYKIRSAES